MNHVKLLGKTRLTDLYVLEYEAHTHDRSKCHRDVDYLVSEKREIYHQGVLNSIINGYQFGRVHLVHVGGEVGTVGYLRGDS